MGGTHCISNTSIGMENLFDVIKHTPFIINGVDATKYLLRAAKSGNQEYVDAVLRLKPPYELMGPLDIEEALIETQHYYEHGDC